MLAFVRKFDVKTLVLVVVDSFSLAVEVCSCMVGVPFCMFADDVLS